MYDDLLDDPKVQRLDPVLFKTWVNLLCLASRGGGHLPDACDIAFALRLDEATLLSRLSDLTAKGLLDESDNTLRPHNWDKRQFVSDNSTERSRRSRSKDGATPLQQDCNVAPTVAATPPETETETEERPLSETSSDESKPEGKRKRVAYPEQFEEFWKSYPTDPNMAKVEAFKAWQKLDADDRGRAFATLPAFKTWVKQQRDYRTLHACRYLSQRRFDGFAGAEQQAGTAALPVKIVLEGTPEWESLKSKNPRLTARDIRTDGGVVRGTYDYGRAA